MYTWPKSHHLLLKIIIIIMFTSLIHNGEFYSLHFPITHVDVGVKVLLMGPKWSKYAWRQMWIHHLSHHHLMRQVGYLNRQPPNHRLTFSSLYATTPSSIRDRNKIFTSTKVWFVKKNKLVCERPWGPIVNEIFKNQDQDLEVGTVWKLISKQVLYKHVYPTL